MTEKIKVFGAPASPYTQKIISILRYRHIPYEVFWGDVPGKLSRLGDIELPKPILLPTLLLKDENGKLTVQKTSNQDTPLTDSQAPIMGIDVWEHAYYLNYQNRRADYVKAAFNIIDWEAVGKRFV